MKNKIQKIWDNYHPFFIKIKKIVKANKILTVFILFVIFSIYFWGISPAQIREQCSTTIKHNDSYLVNNPKYNIESERQKQRDLLAYVDCRNSNLASGDEYYKKMEGRSPYPFTQNQYNTLSIVELNRLAYEAAYINSSSKLITSFSDFSKYVVPDLDGLNRYILGDIPGNMYYVYNGYLIEHSTYEELKNNKNGYPMCNFPADFEKKELWAGGGEYKTNATDVEYKTCLRKNGITDDKILTPQEIRENKQLCYKWYGKQCDDPNFSPKE